MAHFDGHDGLARQRDAVGGGLTAGAERAGGRGARALDVEVGDGAAVADEERPAVFERAVEVDDRPPVFDAIRRLEDEAAVGRHRGRISMMAGSAPVGLVAELSKKPGVFYAVSADGIELPVVDVTHPSFALPLARGEATALIERYARAEARRGRLQQWARHHFYGYFLKRSVLGRALMGAAGTFLPGMPTYLMKLGPDHLGAGYAQEIDRRIAASPPALAMRLRLLDVATLLAEGLAPALARDAAPPLHLVNVGGGPASDSLNALIVLRKEHPASLEGRAIRIHVLDRDDRGPLFGARALEALRGDGGPLRGLDVALDHVRYDWTDTTVLDATLAALARAGGIVACSSEGALFDYGTDEEIRANLAASARIARGDDRGGNHDAGPARGPAWCPP